MKVSAAVRPSWIRCSVFAETQRTTRRAEARGRKAAHHSGTKKKDKQVRTLWKQLHGEMGGGHAVSEPLSQQTLTAFSQMVQAEGDGGPQGAAGGQGPVPLVHTLTFNAHPRWTDPHLRFVVLPLPPERTDQRRHSRVENGS